MTLDLEESAAIQGFLAGSSNLDRFNPVMFSVNHNFLGVGYGPMDSTTELVLPAGRHVLRCHCRLAPLWRHSAWGLKRQAIDYKPQLAVMTVGRYPIKELDWKISDFTRSLTQFGMQAHVCGAGEPTVCWFHDKIADVLASVEALPEHYTHVLFSDATDSFVLGGEETILAEFSKMSTEFVISMERGCWPIPDPEWNESFPHAVDNRRWPNAGGWMGTRSGIIRVLRECVRIYDEVTGSGLTGPLKYWQRYSAYAHDDQWIMQLAFLARTVPMTPDYDCRIFTNFGTAAKQLIDNPDYEAVGNRIRSKPGNTFPLVIHFSGGAWRECRDQWQALLNLKQPSDAPAICG
ncbi:glycosyltransferase domain-containing protein [Luteolibacter sp.]|uniref:glycosyltransferase domain-containing protein n=1 Tax=Luteolibacter sp. TaxID=1962973 RepID=UPI003263A61D